MTRAYVRFAGGHRRWSSKLPAVAVIGRSKWRTLGTHDGIEVRRHSLTGSDEVRVVSIRDGQRIEGTVPTERSDQDGFYRNVADHLILREPLAVTAESARKVIAVLSLSEQSSRPGGVPLRLPFEQ